MPVIREVHHTRRHTPYGHSAGVRHRGTRALARYGTRVGASRNFIRSKAKNRVVNVPRNKLAFPQSISTKLRYVEKIDMGSLSTQDVSINQFIANGAYDPNFTGTGHQPRGFDQFCGDNGAYETYTVTGSKLSVNFVYDGYQGPSSVAIAGQMLQPGSTDAAESVNAASAVICGVHKGMTALDSGTAESQMEKERTQWKIMTPETNAVTLSTNLAVKDFFGINGSPVGQDGYTGSKSANPTNKCYYMVWVGRVNPYNVAICRVQAYVTIEFDVTFSEPKNLEQS